MKLRDFFRFLGFMVLGAIIDAASFAAWGHKSSAEVSITIAAALTVLWAIREAQEPST